MSIHSLGSFPTKQQKLNSDEITHQVRKVSPIFAFVLSTTSEIVWGQNHKNNEKLFLVQKGFMCVCLWERERESFIMTNVEWTWMSTSAQKWLKNCCTSSFRLFSKHGPTTASFSFIFVFFKHTLQTLQQNDIWKNVHPVGIRCGDSNSRPL